LTQKTILPIFLKGINIVANECEELEATLDSISNPATIPAGRQFATDSSKPIAISSMGLRDEAKIITESSIRDEADQIARLGK
jgi:hypothetical protein